MYHEARALAMALEQYPVLHALPSHEAWRLCIDAKAVGDGRHAGLRFDDEPGYMAGMYRALALMAMQDARGIDLDAGSLVNLHDTAVHGVFERSALTQGLAWCGPDTLQVIDGLTAPQAHFPEALQPTGAMAPLPAVGIAGPQGMRQIRKGLRDPDETTAVPLTIGGNASEAGLAELKAKGEQWSRVAQGAGMGRSRLASRSTLRTQPKGAGELMGRIQDCLDDCRRGCAAAARDTRLMLRAIAACCQDLEQLHPFPDGNARTIGVLVLNKLLLEQGLPPAALADANRLDAFSVEEVVREIEVGQERFGQVVKLMTRPRAGPSWL